MSSEYVDVIIPEKSHSQQVVVKVVPLEGGEFTLNEVHFELYGVLFTYSIKPIKINCIGKQPRLEVTRTEPPIALPQQYLNGERYQI